MATYAGIPIPVVSGSYTASTVIIGTHTAIRLGQYRSDNPANTASPGVGVPRFLRAGTLSHTLITESTFIGIPVGTYKRGNFSHIFVLSGSIWNGRTFWVLTPFGYRTVDVKIQTGTIRDNLRNPLPGVKLQFIGATVLNNFSGATTDTVGVYIAYLLVGDTYSVVAFNTETGFVYTQNLKDDEGTFVDYIVKEIAQPRGINGAIVRPEQLSVASSIVLPFAYFTFDAVQAPQVSRAFTYFSLESEKR